MLLEPECFMDLPHLSIEDAFGYQSWGVKLWNVHYCYTVAQIAWLSLRSPSRETFTSATGEWALPVSQIVWPKVTSLLLGMVRVRTRQPPCFCSRNPTQSLLYWKSISDPPRLTQLTCGCCYASWVGKNWLQPIFWSFGLTPGHAVDPSHVKNFYVQL